MDTELPTDQGALHHQEAKKKILPGGISAPVCDTNSVGLNSDFVWRVPFNAPTWAGHHYVLELTRDPITRGLRKAVAERIQGFEQSLATLSRIERNDILRRASGVPD